MKTGITKGFTLLELLVVIAIMGLLATVAVVRLLGPLRAARVGEIAQRIASADDQVRSHARRFARGSRLVYDLDEELVYAESDAASGVRQFEYEIPRNVRLTRVRLVRGDLERGKATIEIASDGHSPTYAVRLDSVDREGQWLLFSGRTGQVTRLEAEADVQELFRLLGQ